ncbi:MAG: hypothetical protein O7I42_12565 [Alphaproteobacteria bacterium]|nr:hypothetical protein [Alphaproteobacteria bacterium]
MTEPKKHWLVRPGTIKILWVVFVAILALTLIAGVFIPNNGYFGADGYFGFFAAFGFGVCVVMVLVAKALGFFLTRPDSYYDD